MTLGFSVPELLPHARNGGKLKIGLRALDEHEWLQPHPDLPVRVAAFAKRPEAIQTTEASRPAEAELATMLGLSGGLPEAARLYWEDMCLLSRRTDEDFYRLIGAAVAFPTDWRVEDKMGLPLAAMHAPIHGYAEQLATGVDRFMAKLKPGQIYGRSNWFVVDSGDLCHLPGGRAQFLGVTAENAGERLFARCERQTLRRLPQSGAILFTIGVYVEPLSNLPPDAAHWIAEAVQAIPAGERERRGIEAYLPALVSYARTLALS